jgi:hypothetical protein
VRAAPRLDKFQVLTSQGLREQSGIEPGQKLQALAWARRIELLPGQAPQSVRGFLPGLDSTVLREGDRV